MECRGKVPACSSLARCYGRQSQPTTRAFIATAIPRSASQIPCRFVVNIVMGKPCYSGSIWRAWQLRAVQPARSVRSKCRMCCWQWAARPSWRKQHCGFRSVPKIPRKTSLSRSRHWGKFSNGCVRFGWRYEALFRAQNSSRNTGQEWRSGLLSSYEPAQFDGQLVLHHGRDEIESSEEGENFRGHIARHSQTLGDAFGSFRASHAIADGLGNFDAGHLVVKKLAIASV